MAGSLTDVAEKAVLNYLFRSTAITLDASNFWLALFTASPTDSTTGTEVSGTAYVRMPIDRTGAGFSAASGTTASTANVPTVTWPTPLSSWGTIVSVGVCTSLAGSLSTDLFAYADLSVSRTISTGDIATFAASSLTITVD